MNVLLQHGVTAQATARPQATAVVGNGTRLTYGELESASNRLAQFLVDAGCQFGDRVGLLMPKMPAAIVGMLGALKAGAAYVPLDPADPPARLARTLEAADCRWILCAGPVAQTLAAAVAAARLDKAPLVGWLDEQQPPEHGPRTLFRLRDLDAFPTALPPSLNRDCDLAQLLFTSGSTGTPKGVMITHRNVVSFIRWGVDYFGIDSTDRVSQHSRLRFDVSTFDIFATLWAGGELYLVPPTLNLLPHKLAQFIRDARLTQWFSVPSVLTQMAKFDAVREHDFPSLRRVLFAGEVVPTPTLIHWMRRLPHVRFTNLYGPTETTISSSYHTLRKCPGDPRAPIPIGTACDGEELLVLDRQLHPVPDGEIGDLYVRGVGLSPGYWRDPDKTLAAFLPDPTGSHLRDRIYRTGDRARRDNDGVHYFCGREDMQIKSRGYRIEIGEVESALHAIPELRESAVVAIDSPDADGSMICCAYVLAPGIEFSTRHLRGRLAAVLPSYMLPQRWMRYESLPKNVNAKIDRPCLGEAFGRAEAERHDRGTDRIPRQEPGRASVPRTNPQLQPT